jgi:dTDP-L-rhamnose 4-epimerase
VGILKEKMPQNLSPCALSKYATKRLATNFSYALGIPTVALCNFNVYGPRQSLSNPYTGVIAIFLSRMISGNSPYLFEEGRQLRDCIYVEDVAGINVASLTKGQGVYNVGTGRATSLLDIVGMLNTAAGLDITPEISGDFRPGDNRHDFADNSRLRKAFGDIKFTDMHNGIKRLVE